MKDDLLTSRLTPQVKKPIPYLVTNVTSCVSLYLLWRWPHIWRESHSVNEPPPLPFLLLLPQRISFSFWVGGLFQVPQGDDGRGGFHPQMVLNFTEISYLSGVNYSVK